MQLITKLLLAHGYAPKGQPLTRIDPAVGGTTAYTTFDNTSSIWQSSTITARGAIIFNDDSNYSTS